LELLSLEVDEILYPPTPEKGSDSVAYLYKTQFVQRQTVWLSKPPSPHRLTSKALAFTFTVVLCGGV